MIDVDQIDNKLFFDAKSLLLIITVNCNDYFLMIPIHIILPYLHDHYFLQLGFIGLFFAEIPFPLLAGKAIIAQMTFIQ
jgi:hypothetical protein